MERLLTCRDKDLYSILGVARDASEEEIKRHYRKQAVMVHPDKVRGTRRNHLGFYFSRAERESRYGRGV